MRWVLPEDGLVLRLILEALGLRIHVERHVAHARGRVALQVGVRPVGIALLAAVVIVRLLPATLVDGHFPLLSQGPVVVSVLETLVVVGRLVLVVAEAVLLVEGCLVARRPHLLVPVVHSVHEVAAVLLRRLHGEGLRGGVERLARGHHVRKFAVGGVRTGTGVGVSEGQTLGKGLHGRGLTLDVLHLELGGEAFGKRLGQVLAALRAGDAVGVACLHAVFDYGVEVGVVEEGGHGVHLAEEPGVVSQVEALARVVHLHAVLAHTVTEGIDGARALDEELRVLAGEGDTKELLLDVILELQELSGSDPTAGISLEALVNKRVEYFIVLG